jgi:hypothetical protein
MRTNLQLGQPISTYDLGEALKLQTGHFKVIPPDGDPFYVTCEAGKGITDVQWPNQTNAKPLTVIKVFEPTNGMIEERGPTALPVRAAAG